MSELAERLASEFADKDYAHAYMESHAVSRLAAQVHALRKQRRWSQQQLSERAGIAQERISKIESADFSSLTLATLHKLARAFDVDVRVAFESFSQGVLDVVNLTPKALEVAPRQVALKAFEDRRLKIDRDGGWQLVDPQTQARLQLLPQVAPATPRPEWTRITAAEG
ncbi:MAG: helix-turn-helix domain-containing protein [Gammaproteobacteria bacterium]|nr:helix-turn-helix domain-containing protein [Gammaproteobacteria bacterium]